MMATDVPEFDPSKPFEAVGGSVPEFDPSKPFEPVGQDRGVLERAGSAMGQTFQSGLSHAQQMFAPPEPGVGGAIENLKGTALGLMSPLTMTVGAGMSGAASLIASGMAPLAQGVGRTAARALEPFSPTAAERVRGQIPTSEEAYQKLYPGAETALMALGPRVVPRGAAALPSAGGWARAPVPVVPRGPEAEAANILKTYATDITALEPKLTAPDIVPGSKGTTFQVTGDVGLGQLERVAETRSPQGFNILRGEQNAKRLEELDRIQASGSPQDVTDHLRSVQRSLDTAAESDLKLAQQRAWDAAQQVGGTYDPTTYGNILRRELQNAEEAARANERTLWQRVDPDGTLTARVDPIQRLERDIYGNMTQAGSMTLTPAETGIANLIQEYRVTVPFRELTDLRSVVSSAMREELMLRGRTPAYGRLSRLRGGIEDAVLNDVMDIQNQQWTQGAAERLREASAATRERAGRFNIAPVRDILRKEGLEGIYKLQEGAIPGRIITPGPKGYDSASAFLRAVGNREGLPVLQDAVAAEVRRAAVGADGLVDSSKLANWVKRHGDVLRAIDERDGGVFMGRLQNASDASNVLGDVAARRADLAERFTKGEFGKLIGSVDDADISNIIGSAFSGRNAVQKARDLAQQLTTPASKEGAQRAIVEFIRKKYVSNTEASTSEQNLIRADQFQSFVKNSRGALQQFFSPEQIKSMEAIAADIHRANRSVGTGIRGRSTTVQDISGVEKYGSILGHLLTHVPGGKWPGRAVRLGVGGMRILRDAGMRDVNKLVDAAMLDPEVARDLLQSAKGTEMRFPGLKRWSMYQLGLASSRATPEEKFGGRVDSSESFKHGGRVTKSFRIKQ